MPQTGHLLIEAKQVVTEEQLRKFLDLSRKEEWEEASMQLALTLACVADLLNESVDALRAHVPSGFPEPFRYPKGDHQQTRSAQFGNSSASPGMEWLMNRVAGMSFQSDIRPEKPSSD